MAFLVLARGGARVRYQRLMCIADKSDLSRSREIQRRPLPPLDFLLPPKMPLLPLGPSPAEALDLPLPGFDFFFFAGETPRSFRVPTLPFF